MLNGKLIHPQIMAALALCGHGDKVLIADGNYPLASKTAGAQTVYLGLKAGQPTVTDVLAAVQSVINIEKAEVMDPADGTLHNIVLILQPGKERRYDTPDIVNGDFAGVMDFLITRQVKTNIIGFYFTDFFLNKIDHVEQGGGVIFNGVF